MSDNQARVAFVGAAALVLVELRTTSPGALASTAAMLIRCTNACPANEQKEHVEFWRGLETDQRSEVFEEIDALAWLVVLGEVM